MGAGQKLDCAVCACDDWGMRMCLAVIWLAGLIRAAPADATPTSRPSWPQGYIVWSSGRAGVNCIYRMKADGSEIVRLAEEESDYPRWSPDGRWISYVTADATWIMRPDGSGKKKLATQIDWPEWSSDGKTLVGAQIDERARVLVEHELETGRTATLVDFDRFLQLKGARIAKPALVPQRRWLYVMTDRFDGGYIASNGFHRPSGAWAVAALDLRNPAALYYVGDGCQPAVDRTGEKIYHPQGENGAIARMDGGDLMCKSYWALFKPDKQLVWAYCPCVSSDGRWIAYVGASRHESWGVGDYDVYIQGIEPDAPRMRLAAHPGNDRWPDLWVGELRLAGSEQERATTRPATQPAERIALVGELVATSKLPSPFNIKPYRECLILTRYRVVRAIEGKVPEGEVLVVHWGMKDLRPTSEAGFKLGQRQRLVCEPFAAHKKLERYPMANDIRDSPGADWWLAVEWGVSE